MGRGPSAVTDIGAVPRPLRLMGLLADLRLSPASIRRVQERKLRAIVAHAGRHVPFYRELYRRAGVDPGSIRGLDDLPRLPLTAKSDFQDRPLSDLLDGGLAREAIRSSSTSGSSGAPLRVHWLPADKTVMNLSWKRAYLVSGMRTSDRVAAFVGGRQGAPGNRWRERLGFFPRREISSWLEPRQWVDILRSWRPQVISGYVMTLRLLADFLDDGGITDVRPRLLFHSSALLDDASRALFTRVFGCRVVDIYGSEEAGCIAWECRTCSGYHLAADMLVVEVLKDGRPAQPGEQGEIVVTNLQARAMPFIRYRQGDVVTVSRNRPRCGCAFPLIANIEGRIDDFIVLRNGRRMSPHPLYHCLDPVPGIRQWRIDQETAGTMRLELVADAGLPDGSLGRIRKELADLTQGELDVEIAMTDDIPVMAGVKFRRVSSRAARKRI